MKMLETRGRCTRGYQLHSTAARNGLRCHPIGTAFATNFPGKCPEQAPYHYRISQHPTLSPVYVCLCCNPGVHRSFVFQVWDEKVDLGFHNSGDLVTVTVMDADSGLEFGDDVLYSAEVRVPWCSAFHAAEATADCEDGISYTCDTQVDGRFCDCSGRYYFVQQYSKAGSLVSFFDLGRRNVSMSVRP